MGNGCLLLLAILLYLNALKRNEPSIVAPFFQSIPIFGFILSYMILRESLNYNQILASGLIVIGGLVLSVETFSGSYRIKKRLLLLMGGSCILYALNVVIFKSIAIQQGFLDSLFWDMVGKVMLGLFLFSFIQSYRKQFYYLLKANRLTIIGLNILNEGIALIGEIALVFASLFAPITVVQSVGGLQPAFVFFLGVIFSLLFPKFSQESLRPNVLVKKLIGIVIISAGAFLINI